MAQVALRTLARPPRKPRKGEVFRLNFYVAGEMVEAIDSYAKVLDAQRAAADPTIPAWAQRRTATTRTEAVRVLLIAALKQHGLLK